MTEDKMIMPSSYEFDSIMEALKSYMKSTVEFKGVNWEGSAAQALLRVLAYNTQMNQVGLNYIFGELNPMVATKKESVASIASGLLGYLPQSRKASKLIADIIVEAPVGDNTQQITLSRKTNFFAAKNGQALNFSPRTDVVAQKDNGFFRFTGVELVQGDWITEAWPVQTTYGLESYTLSNPNIDLNTLEIGVIQNASSTSVDKYKQVQDAYDLGPEEKSFFLRMNTRGAYVVEFGDGKLAKKLKSGQVIIADYIVTQGEEGNGITEINLSGDIGGFFDVTIKVTGPSNGGAEEEGIETIRRAATMEFAGQGSAVSSRDFVALVRKLLPGSVVASWGGEDNDPPKPGFQILAVKPKDAFNLTEAQKKSLEQQVTKYCVGSISPFFVTPDYTYVNVKSRVIYNSGKTLLDKVGMQSKIKNAIKTFSKEKLEFFGADFIYSDLVTKINNSDDSILGNVTGVTFDKKFDPEILTVRSYNIKFNMSIERGSVSVTDFIVYDSDFEGWTYSLVDVDGVLKMIKKHDTKGQVTFNGSYGVVDYQTGLITIDNFAPVKAGSRGTNVRVKPQEADSSFFTEGKSIIFIDSIEVEMDDRRGR